MQNSAFMGQYQDTANPMSDVEVLKPRRSAFSLNNLAQGTVDAGLIYPVFSRIAFPGDVFHIGVETIIRANPLASPAMTNYKVKTAFFSVPLRIIWNHSKDDRFTVFINGGKDGTLAPNIPLWTNISENGKYSLADYLGLPLGKKYSDDVKPIAFIPRSYWKVINDWFITEDAFSEDGFDFEDPVTYNLPLFSPAWEPDYFNKSLPFAQRGEAPAIPIIGAGKTVFEVDSGYFGSDYAVLTRDDMYPSPDWTPVKFQNRLVTISTGPQGQPGQQAAELHLDHMRHNSLMQTDYFLKTTQDWKTVKMFLDQNRVDFTNNSGIFINDLRMINAVQLALEMSARIGYRYNEFVYGNFGVKTSDARMQRAEMIGQIVESPILFSEVLQTAPDSTGNGVGNMKGHGITANDGFVGTFEAEEHCVVIGLQWIMPDTSIYWQGLHREWMYRDRFDFYLPMFAHLGEQPVYNYELFLSDDDVYNKGVFGYQQAFAHLRESTTVLTGDFRDTMNYYVTSRNFAEDSKPVYSAEFIHAKPNKSIFVGQSDEYKSFIYTTNSVVKALRPMPVISDPSLLA